jgi:tetratricopeptide (TPR) repeat protein
MGEALRCENHIDKAIEHLTTAIGMNPKNWIAMGRLGICYEDRESWDQAIECCRKAIDLCPKKSSQKSLRSSYWQTISWCCLEIYDYEQAKDAARQSCLLEPEDGDALSTYILALGKHITSLVVFVLSS